MIKLNLQTSLSTPLRSFSLGSEHSTVVAFQAVTPPTRVQVWSSTTFFLNFFFPPHSRLNHRVSVTSKHANFFVHKKQETATHTDALNHFFFVFFACLRTDRCRHWKLFTVLLLLLVMGSIEVVRLKQEQAIK